MEMDKAIALWKREHDPPKSGTLSCLFTDKTLNANIEIEVENGRMDIWCDRKIAVENVTSLLVNRTYVPRYSCRITISWTLYISLSLSLTHTHTHTDTVRSSSPRKIRNNNYLQRFVRAIVDVSSRAFVNMQHYRP